MAIIKNLSLNVCRNEKRAFLATSLIRLIIIFWSENTIFYLFTHAHAQNGKNFRNVNDFNNQSIINIFFCFSNVDVSTNGIFDYARNFTEWTATSVVIFMKLTLITMLKRMKEEKTAVCLCTVIGLVVGALNSVFYMKLNFFCCALHAPWGNGCSFKLNLREKNQQMEDQIEHSTNSCACVCGVRTFNNLGVYGNVVWALSYTIPIRFVLQSFHFYSIHPLITSFYSY